MTKEFPELDDKCNKILMVLLVKEGNLHFTEIFNALDELKIGMTKPTLAQHLKHLEIEKIVTKKEKHKNVIYTVRDDFIILKSFLDRTADKILQEKAIDDIIEMVEEKKDLLSMPVKNQVEEVLRMIAGRALFSLQAKIEFESGKIEFGLLAQYLELPYFKRHERWLREQCLQDKAYRIEVLQNIDDLVGSILPPKSK